MQVWWKLLFVLTSINTVLYSDLCGHKIRGLSLKVKSQVVTGDPFEMHVTTGSKRQCLSADHLWSNHPSLILKPGVNQTVIPLLLVLCRCVAPGQRAFCYFIACMNTKTLKCTLGLIHVSIRASYLSLSDDVVLGASWRKCFEKLYSIFDHLKIHPPARFSLHFAVPPSCACSVFFFTFLNSTPLLRLVSQKRESFESR